MQIREFMTQPVVNAQGKLSGIITVSDFAAKEQGISFSTFRAPQVFGHWLGGEPLEQMRYDIGPLTWQLDAGAVGYRTADVS